MTIILTPTAVSEIHTIKQSQNLAEETFVRLSILGGGCSGLQYSLGFDTVFDSNVDIRYFVDNVALVTAKKFDLFLDGTEVDFRNTEYSKGFLIENPNFPKGAGCPGCHG